MKPLSETYKELGIAFGFPIEIRDDLGRLTYYENSSGRSFKREYDSKGDQTYFEDSSGFWYKRKHDSNGNAYYENSDGFKHGTPRSVKTYEGKVVEVDGIKYELRSL